MKKLLGLVLILAVASLANASLLLYQGGVQVGDSITMLPGQTITLQINSSDTLAWNAYVINGADETAAGVLSGPVGLAAAGNMSSNSIYAAGDGWGNGFLFGTGGSPVTPPVVFSVLAGVQHTVAFTAGSAGTTITLYDATSYEPIDSVSIIVPEPATIGLLCLGGLLLRKKA